MVEPEWTDRYRDLAEGLALHDQELCPGCNLHPSSLADGSGLHLALVDTYCEMCKSKDRHRRRLEGADLEFEKAHKDIPPGAPRPNDGLHVRIKSMTPAEVAQREERRRTDG